MTDPTKPASEMTVGEYAAIQFMAALINSPDAVEQINRHDKSLLVQGPIDMADALLARLESEGEDAD